MTVGATFLNVRIAFLSSSLGTRLKSIRAARKWRRLAKKKAAEFYAMYYKPEIDRILPSILESGELNNFIYDLNGYNVDYMVDIIACALGRPFEEIERYVEEVLNDKDLHIAGEIPASIRCGFGRRMGWYAIARAIKPKIIVETGVERGHGALGHRLIKAYPNSD